MRHRFSPEIIQCAVWLYFWFNLSRRDIKDLLARRGILVGCCRLVGRRVVVVQKTGDAVAGDRRAWLTPESKVVLFAR